MQTILPIIRNSKIDFINKQLLVEVLIVLKKISYFCHSQYFNSFFVKNKVVVITGASSGIGRALAKDFASKGARLSLAARRLDLLEQLKSELPDSEILIKKTDVSNENDCKELIDETIKRFGQIDILINNAGISMRAIFEDVDLNVIRQLMDINFFGTVYCSKYALPHLLKTKGSLVGVISIAGFVGLPGRSGYSASKFAIRGFLDTIRVENMKKGLHVMVAAPGFTATEVRKMALTSNGSKQGETPRNENAMMSAEACASHIINAISRRKRELVLTFTEGKLTVFVNKFFPSLLDKFSYRLMAKEPNSPLK
jgi:short-subunit dehydrogenase